MALSSHDSDVSSHSLNHSDSSEASILSIERLILEKDPHLLHTVYRNTKDASLSGSESAGSSLSLSLSPETISPQSSTTSLSSRPVSFSQSSTIVDTLHTPRHTKIPKIYSQPALSPKYTRPIIKIDNIKPSIAIRSVSSRERSNSARRTARSKPKPKANHPGTTSTRSPHYLPPLPKGHYYVYSPTNTYTNPYCYGPKLSTIPNPIPDMLVTDFSLLACAADRYASSPLAQKQTRMYHNIADPRSLGRYSGRGKPGYKIPRCRAVGLEVVDAQLFTAMGGQESVAVLGYKHIMQWKVVERGCPSGCCGCSGRGLAMAGCGDLTEDADEAGWQASVLDGLLGVRSARMPVTDRVEEARRMRMRIARLKRDRADGAELENGSESRVVEKSPWMESKIHVGIAKKLRRRKSKFVEVGCSLGDDSVERLDSTLATPRNSQELPVKALAPRLGDGRKLKSAIAAVGERSKLSWIKKIMRV